MSEFIIAVVVIAVVLFVISKARKKSVEVKSETTSYKAPEIKPIVEPLARNEPVAKVEPKVKVAKAEPKIKTEEKVANVATPKKVAASKLIASTKVTKSDVQIPQDSTLRRHYLSELHVMLQNCKVNRPTDSTLARHYDESVQVMLSDFTHDVDEIKCLFSFYTNN
jgi:hypothetical protein